MNEYLPALMRTLVPAIYGWFILHFAVVRFVPAGIGQLAVSAAILGVVYLILRGLEKLRPELGILLGWIGAPRYATAAAESAIDEAIKLLQPTITSLMPQDLNDLRAAVMKELMHSDPKLLLHALNSIAQPAAALAPTATSIPAAPAASPALPTAAQASDIGQVDAVVDTAEPIIAPQVPTGADGRPAADTLQD